MSTTIGFGYAAPDGIELFAELKPIAEKYGYGLLNGAGFSEIDVRPGLEIAQKNEGWREVLFLQSPKHSNTSLAFGVYEEMMRFEMTGSRPKFFDFLVEISKLCAQRCKKLSIFFADEWHQDDRVRYSYGDIERLLLLLSMPGHWGIRFMIPQTGRLQDSYDMPLLFDISLK
jgi:hypothetical protein